jgi:hypothetical protein
LQATNHVMAIYTENVGHPCGAICIGSMFANHMAPCGPNYYLKSKVLYDPECYIPFPTHRSSLWLQINDQNPYYLYNFIFSSKPFIDLSIRVFSLLVLITSHPCLFPVLVGHFNWTTGVRLYEQYA